ncbi:MAG: hypothetical protein WA445_11815 [Pseudolabrys sp.]
MLRRKGYDQIAMKRRSAQCHHQPAVRGARELCDRALYFRDIGRIDRAQFHTERRRYGLDDGKLADSKKAAFQQ